MFIYQASHFVDAPFWMLNGQNRLFTQEVLPSKCLINKWQHLTFSFEKPLCSQVFFKYLIRYAIICFFLSLLVNVFSRTCTHSRNEAELSTVWCAAFGVDRAALGVNGGRLIAGQRGWQLLFSTDVTSKFSMTHFLSADEWPKKRFVHA